MELVDGPTLEERIGRGPIPIADALHIARQIAEALEAAHELGIIHRDLKPANVKLKIRGTPGSRSEDSERRLSAPDIADCTVKVLDFGLAKSLDHAAAGGNPQDSPTLTARSTGLGIIIGTAAYMAPEQARGRLVDRRADIWSFGVVLYEMLTGRRLFKGQDISDTMAAVLREPITLTALPAGVPNDVRLLIERCLERDPRQRLRDIGEARIMLERAGSPTGADTSATAAVARTTRSRALALVPWLLFAAAMVVLMVVLAPWTRPLNQLIRKPRLGS